MSHPTQYDLSIITPCYNPLNGWEQTYLNTYKIIKERLSNIQIEWILVNDGSIENVSLEQIHFLKNNIENLKYLYYNKNQGKGYAIRYGVRQSSAQKLIFTDIDFPYLDENIQAIYLNITNDNDIVIGRRSQEYYQHLPISRILISKFLKFSMRILLNIPTTDTQAGIKGFNSQGKAILLSTTINRYLFDLETIKLASKNKLNIKEVNVSLKPNIVIPPMSNKILFKEFFNFIKIAFK